MIIPAITLRKRKIVESEELEKYESGPLWVVDEDYKSGRELNFKRYDDLSGLYEVYLDAEIAHVDDIADSITAGATMVTISETLERDKIKRALFYTSSLILFVKSRAEAADFFIENGGGSVYSDSFVVEKAQVQYTSKLNCERCNVVIPIGGFNGGRNKEASLLP
jgi:hypothetical protein